MIKLFIAIIFLSQTVLFAGASREWVQANTDRVTFSNGGGTGNEFTHCIWFNRTADVGTDAMFSWEPTSGDKNFWELGINSSANIEVQSVGSDGSSFGWNVFKSNDTFPAGKWRHLCQWWDGNEPMLMYVNGVSVATTHATNVGTVIMTDTSRARAIGVVPGTPRRHWDGRLMDHRIFSTTRTSKEIQELAHGNLTYLENTSDLVFHHLLQDGGDIMIDLAQNENGVNDGTEASDDGPPVFFPGGL